MSGNIQEEVEVLRRRIALLDGDKKAYSETSQWAMKQNKELISQLRAENKTLRSKLSQKMKADDDVISDVFQAHNMKTPAEIKGLTGPEALRKFDQTVCEQIKRRNSLQHVRRSREQTSASLEIQLSQMVQELASSEVTPAGDTEDDRRLRQLENRLNKAVIKCNEAKHIQKMYEVIVEKLQEERLEFDNQIAELERAIKRRQQDFKAMECMCSDAQMARDMALTELTRQEQSMAVSRREREKVLSEYRKQAEEKKEFADKVEKRLRHISMQHGSSAGHLDTTVESIQEDQEAHISSYEEALAKIKDATGVSDIQEVVDRFLNQGNTRRHLEVLREENTRQLARLQEEKEKLQAQFEDMKYSGEAKMSAGQRMLEEFQTHLEQEKSLAAESKERADRASRLLAEVKNGVDHLTEKLENVKAPHTHLLRPKLSPDSDEYIVEQLNTVEQKLVSVAEEMESRDVDTIHREMQDEEFRHTVEGGMAAQVRIELPKGEHKSMLYGDDSGSDEEFVSRESMKRTTAALVEAKTRKKPQDDDDEESGGKKRKRR